MRRALLIGLGLATCALLAPAAGCTFLVSFDDAPTNDAGTPDIRPSPPGNSDSGTANPTGTDADTGAPSTDPCDRTYVDQIKGCDYFKVPNGRICADDEHFVNYPSPATVKNDIVTCQTPKATCVVHCPALCAHLPENFPDECDQCAGKVDGDYCGSQFGWDAKNAGLLVHCKGNAIGQPAPFECAGSRCGPGSGKGDAKCN